MMTVYIEYPAKNKHVAGDSLYADVANHCDNWSYYGRGDKLTGAHEATHGINNQIRNAHGVMYKIRHQGLVGLSGCWPPLPEYPYCLNCNGTGIRRWDAVVNHYGEEAFSSGSKPCECRADEPKINAFYCLNSHAAIIPEPSCKKSDAVRFVPAFFRRSRFDLYMAGQKEWDSCPLYVWDEWTAYINQALVAIDLNHRGDNAGRDQDTIFGAVEFVAYGLAVLMAAISQMDTLDLRLRDFSVVTLGRAANCFHGGNGVFPWNGQTELWTALTTGPEGQVYRDFMHDALGFTLE